MANELVAKTSAVNPFGLQSLAMKNPFLSTGGMFTKDLPEYLIDAFQRSVLFLEILRKRGNEEAEMTSRPMATVLRFEHDVLVSGRSAAPAD